MLLSATIIVYNEESQIAKTLDALSFADEIVVIDSHSTDRTVPICKEKGCRVYQRTFTNFGDQKNFAAQQAKGTWILNVDADEVVTPALAKEILQTISYPSPAFSLYSIPRLNHYAQRPINYGGWFPDRVNRLYRPQQACWSTPPVHEELRPLPQQTSSLTTGKLQHSLHHFTFNSVQQQVRTNIRYAALGAQKLRSTKGRPPLVLCLLRPLGKFIECYILKRGFLDGEIGLMIAVHSAYSLYLKYILARYPHLDDTHS